MSEAEHKLLRTSESGYQRSQSLIQSTPKVIWSILYNLDECLWTEGEEESSDTDEKETKMQKQKLS